jgi:hypothetical protein
VCIVSNSDYEKRHPYDELYDILIKNDGNLVFVDLIVEYVTNNNILPIKMQLLSDASRSIF